jgi:hypothetical protein
MHKATSPTKLRSSFDHHGNGFHSLSDCFIFLCTVCTWWKAAGTTKYWRSMNCPKRLIRLGNVLSPKQSDIKHYLTKTHWRSIVHPAVPLRADHGMELFTNIPFQVSDDFLFQTTHLTSIQHGCLFPKKNCCGTSQHDRVQYIQLFPTLYLYINIDSWSTSVRARSPHTFTTTIDFDSNTTSAL